MNLFCYNNKKEILEELKRRRTLAYIKEIEKAKDDNYENKEKKKL